MAHGPISECLPKQRCGSNTWRGIKVGREVFTHGLRWVVNNGRNISFWHDKWVGDSTIRELVQGPLIPGEEALKVCDVIKGNSLWDF